MNTDGRWSARGTFLLWRAMLSGAVAGTLEHAMRMIAAEGHG